MESDAGIPPVKGDIPTAEVARKTFRQELKPTLQEAQRLRHLKRTVQEYEQSLDAAVSDKALDEGTINSASFVVRAEGLLKKQDERGYPEPDGLTKARAMNAGKVFDWFKTHYNGTTTLLLSHLKDDDGRINPEREQYFAELVGTNLSHWITVRKGLGKVFKEEIQDKELTKMVGFLLENSRYFSYLSKHLPGMTHPRIEDLNSTYTDLQVQESVLDLNPQVQAFELRDWIAATAKEARQGRKIYETPFYRKILEELHFLGRKKNGVGGVVLYGPPGTGKTELLQEKNRQQGFRSRVVNIHHYTSFEDLIAGKAIQLGLDRSATTAQKLSTVLTSMEKESPDAFIDYIDEVYLQLAQEGKISQNQTFGQFLC